MLALNRSLNLWLPLLVLTGACQDLGQSNASSTPPTPALTQSSFVEEFQKLTCDNFAQCCAAVGLGLDKSQCATLFANAGQGTANAIFNPTYGEQCLSELAQKPSCGTVNNSPACGRAYTGTLSPGQACSSDTDCAKPRDGDSNCDRARGVCVAGLRGELYDPCQQSCEQGTNGITVCTWGPASNTIADGTIVVNCFANDGLICGDTGQCWYLATRGEFCTDDRSCSRELYCAFGTGSLNASCQPRPGIGQSCVEYNLPCAAEAYCNGGVCAAKKASGERCLTNAECSGACNCGASGDCANHGVCIDPDDPVGSYISLLILAGYCGPAETTQ